MNFWPIHKWYHIIKIILKSCALSTLFMLYRQTTTMPPRFRLLRVWYCRKLQSPFTSQCKPVCICGAETLWWRLPRKSYQENRLCGLTGGDIQATKHKLTYSACLKRKYIIHHFSSAATAYLGHWTGPERETAERPPGASPAQGLSPGMALNTHSC